MKTILIPTDCSDHSRISVKYGIQLAKENDAEIKLLYIQENVEIDKEKNKQSDSKVVSISGKDRSAILLGGKNPDIAIWYDKKGQYTTSSYY